MLEIFRFILFLLWVNALPPFVAILFDQKLKKPVDGGRIWLDDRPLFGPHKTIRGIIAASAGAALLSPLIGLSWWVAGFAGLLAMAGDLLSSFIKRRLAFDSGKSAIILDQLFESLFPLLFLNLYQPLALHQNILILCLFILGAYTSSQLWTHVTDHPLPENYPRTVRSSVRFREWRSCHTPLAKWQVWFNLTSFLSDQILLTWFFKITGLYRKGERNALQIRIEKPTFSFTQLPDSFDGLRILFITDLHLDGLEGIDVKIKHLLAGIEADLCLVGGDIRMMIYGESTSAINILQQIMREVHTPLGKFGVLGNHDCIEMLPELENAGLIMLVNDSVAIEHHGERIWIAGVDDPHYYQLHDSELATREIPENVFTIFLAHSPEAYLDAAQHGANLFLCGHTHGGQVCLKEGMPLITNSRAPRYTASGQWQYQQMQGYTSRGVGPSAIPVRFNCPGEISLITLKKA